MMDPDVTLEMVEAGKRVASDIVGAQVAYSMDGLGGSKTWEQWDAEPHPNRDLLIGYVEGRIDSVTAIYLAMERARAKS